MLRFQDRAEGQAYAGDFALSDTRPQLPGWPTLPKLARQLIYVGPASKDLHYFVFTPTSKGSSGEVVLLGPGGFVSFVAKTVRDLVWILSLDTVPSRNKDWVTWTKVAKPSPAHDAFKQWVRVHLKIHQPGAFISGRFPPAAIQDRWQKSFAKWQARLG